MALALGVYAAAILFGYIVGAIPVGYLIGRAYGIDIREHGSGRTGGTNVFRALGPGAAALTILGDSLKGVLTVVTARRILGGTPYDLEIVASLAGAAAVVGHNWSVFLRFRGGAGGVTTALGLVALQPVAGIITVAFGLLALGISHYASIGTFTIGVVGLLSILVMLAVSPSITYPEHLIYVVSALVAIAIALRPNLQRLRQGKERRINFRRNPLAH